MTGWHDYAAILFAAIIIAVLLVLPAEAQAPVTGANKVYMPFVAVTQVTGEGGSGILPVRGG